MSGVYFSIFATIEAYSRSCNSMGFALPILWSARLHRAPVVIDVHSTMHRDLLSYTRMSGVLFLNLL